MELSIILPTYNEGRNLSDLIPKLEDSIKEHVDRFEILVVDENSQDSTNEVLKNLQNTYKNIKFIVRKAEPSLPLSIYEGILKADYEFVMWLDADGSMTPDAVVALIKRQKLNFDEVIIGSRFVEGGGYKGVEPNSQKNIFKTLKNIYNSEDSILAVALSKLFNIFLNSIMKSDIKDMTSGFIIGKKNLFKGDRIYKCFQDADYGEYFTFLMNELQNKNIKLIEVGYICATRVHGVSKTGTNYRQLIKRGIPYLLTAYKIRNENEKNK